MEDVITKPIPQVVLTELKAELLSKEQYVCQLLIHEEICDQRQS
jgi:hypothetical protein